MPQQSLWYDEPEDAFRSLVDALGGFKKVGSEMWPSLAAVAAGQRLAQCLDSSRPEKLSLSEVHFLLKKGREANCHVAMTYLARGADYEAPLPVDPETETQRLQREFIEATRTLAQLSSRIEKRQQGEVRRIA